MDTTEKTLTARTPFIKRLAVATATLAALAISPALLATPAHAAPRATAAASATDAGDDDAGGSGVVNLNTASEDELGLLPGVGPSKAAAILAFRKKYGPFKKVDDLNKVKGFGFKTLKKLKPYLTVSGATTYKGKAKKPATRGGADSAAAAADAP